MKIPIHIFVAVVLVAAVSSFAAVIFSDDFSSCATTNTNWVANSNSTQPSCANGVYTVVNQDTIYSGVITHNLSGTKPSTFTLSAKITPATTNDENLGFCFCINNTTRFYSVQVSADSWIYVYKYGAGDAVLLFNASNSFLTSGTNVIKISKRDSTFNVFCNGHFAGSFHDQSYASGDIALLVPSSTTGTFDDILMTDQFDQGGYDSCFCDNFEDGVLTGWSMFGDNATVNESNHVLSVSTTANQNVFVHNEVHVQDFIMKVVCSNRGGSPDSLYGLFFKGPSSQTQIPMVGFAINGNKQYGAFVFGQSFELNISTQIKGKPFVENNTTTFYEDTLMVSKRAGALYYLFIVNGDTLDSLSDVNFPVVGTGVFCFGNENLTFDNFVASEGTSGECQGTSVVTNRIVHRSAFSNVSPLLVDMRGRSLPASYLSQKNHANAGYILRQENKPAKFQLRK